MSRPISLLEPVTVLTRDECQTIAKRVLGFSTAQEARVVITASARGNSRFAVNQISTAGDNQDVSVVVRSVFGTRSGTASTNRLDDAGLRAVVAASEQLAKLSPEDPEYMPELEPQQYRESIGWSNGTAALDPAGRSAMIAKITDPARAAGLVSTGYLETRVTAQAIANSKGLFAYARDTDAVLTTTVRTADGQGSGWAGAASNDATTIDSAALGARAIEKARRSVNAVAIEPGRYTVVLEPTAVANLTQLIAGAIGARNADEGRSFFTKAGGGNKIGEKIVDERVTLSSDPFDAATPGPVFTGDGLPTKPITWVENGVVRALNYDRYWAKKQGKEPTGAAVGFGAASLKMSGGSETLESLIAGVQRGLLVTRFWYIRPVDPRTILYTGLTRDGTFLIENGKVTRPVRNLRFNESPIFMLNNIEGMGRPERVSASESGNAGAAIVVPPLRVRDFTFTSMSEAV
ncbi:MAG: TldD/PmbA family protein [Gemmatimonadaceae bacterium]|jgi:predicted Zn-dependent protease|nr:TldD/PmbA family protein [Gemmatimonadaceae bacterium]